MTSYGKKESGFHQKKRTTAAKTPEFEQLEEYKRSKGVGLRQAGNNNQLSSYSRLYVFHFVLFTQPYVSLKTTSTLLNRPVGI